MRIQLSSYFIRSRKQIRTKTESASFNPMEMTSHMQMKHTVNQVQLFVLKSMVKQGFEGDESGVKCLRRNASQTESVTDDPGLCNISNGNYQATRGKSDNSSSKQHDVTTCGRMIRVLCNCEINL